MKPTLGKKGRPLAVAVCRVGPERKTLGSGLNVGNIGAEIDVIQPALPAQTHAPIAIHFAFGVSRTSFLDRHSRGRTIWIADTHRGDGKRFVVRAAEKLTAFVELESTIGACGELCLTTTSLFHLLQGARVCLSKVP